MTPTDGMKFARALRDALGLPPGMDKIVIEAEIGKPVRFYVRGYQDAAALSAIVTAVQDVSVNDDATVDFVPLSQPKDPDFHAAGVRMAAQRKIVGMGATPYADFARANGLDAPTPIDTTRNGESGPEMLTDRGWVPCVVGAGGEYHLADDDLPAPHVVGGGT